MQTGIKFLVPVQLNEVPHSVHMLSPFCAASCAPFSTLLVECIRRMEPSLSAPAAKAAWATNLQGTVH